MPEPWRCFVAFRIDPGTIEVLARAQERLRRAGADVKWVETRNLHVTLAFLGDVEPERQPAVQEVVKNVARGTPRMTARIRGVGAFPNDQAPRVIWAGMTFAPDAARTMAARLGSELAPLGFPPEDRPFAGHITLGRCRSPRGRKALTQELQKLGDTDFGSQPVTRVTLFRSVLSAAGPEYSVVAEMDLG